MNGNSIGIFDSGVGGLSILSACKKILPNERFIYVFDRSHAPYGNRSHRYICKRVDAVTEVLLKNKVKAIVVACNTATNVGIKYLREKHNIPFVGVEPPVKPAFEKTANGKILVLCTKLTAEQKKFRDLIDRFDQSRLIISPQSELASEIETNFYHLGQLRKTVYRTLCKYGNISAVVLGCTHYYYIKPLIEDFYGGTVAIFDAGEGAARRLKFRLEEASLSSETYSCQGDRFIYL